jgi:hypothetical protein
MLGSIFIGVVIVAAIVAIAYAAKHTTKPVSPTGKEVATSVTASLEPTFMQLSKEFGDALAGVPALISNEVAQLKTDLAAALQRAETAEANLLAEQQGRAASLAAVKDQVGAVIASIGAQPAAAVTASETMAPAPVQPAAPIPAFPPIS